MFSKTFVICAVVIFLGLVGAYLYMPKSLPTIVDDTSPVLVDNTLIPESLSDSPEALGDEFSGTSSLPTDATSLEELQADLAATVLQREQIEESLRVVELKVGALENQLDNIELRGDDPADVQGETLDSFKAIFAEYQDAINALDKIEAKELWLEDKISDLID